MMWLASVTTPINQKRNDVKRTIHDKIMGMLYVGICEVFVIFPLSLSAGLVTKGLYVSPGSVQFYNNPILEVSGVIVSFAFISLQKRVWFVCKQACDGCNREF